MKLKKISILCLIISILLMNIGIVTSADKSRGHGIHVFGEVEVDGESLPNANITLQSQDRENEYHTITNSNGEYNILATSIDHEDFLVIVDHEDGWGDSKWFEAKGNQDNYEVNFEFQTNGNGNGNVTIITKTISFFEGIYDWFYTINMEKIIKCLIVLFLVILIIRLLFPRRKTVSGQGGSDNDTIILMPSSMNTKLKRF